MADRLWRREGDRDIHKRHASNWAIEQSIGKNNGDLPEESIGYDPIKDKFKR